MKPKEGAIEYKQGATTLSCWRLVVVKIVVEIVLAIELTNLATNAFPLSHSATTTGSVWVET